MDIYPGKIVIQKDTCTSVFIAALCTIGTVARTWKQPKCPSTEEWVKKVWCTNTMEYYSAIKKNKVMPFAAKWVGLEIVILREVSQKEKNKYCTVSLRCGFQKNGTDELIHKVEIETQM